MEVLTRVSAALWTALTVSLSVFEVTVAAPKLAVPEAVLVIEPASRSAWVAVSDAVHVMNAPGARLAVTGQNSSLAWLSDTANGPVRVTLPVLVSLKL